MLNIFQIFWKNLIFHFRWLQKLTLNVVDNRSITEFGESFNDIVKVLTEIMAKEIMISLFITWFRGKIGPTPDDVGLSISGVKNSF